MELIRDAANAVQKNLAALGIYMAITLVAFVVVTLVGIHMGQFAEETPAEPNLLYQVTMHLFLVFIGALAQSVAFSRMAKEIDRPLWKISGDLEAIKNYMPLWAGLNAIMTLIVVLLEWSDKTYGASGGTALLYIVWVLAAIVYIPAGASLMFLRTAEWTHLPEAMRPLFRQFSKTLVVLAFTGVVFLIHLTLIEQTVKQPWLRSLIELAFAYFDCVVFAAILLVCMYDRQTPEEVDLDF